jgi:Domain of unknown function (DUF4411)
MVSPIPDNYWFAYQPDTTPEESSLRPRLSMSALKHTLPTRKAMFREMDDAVQVEAAQVLSQFPRLVGERKLRTSADPFVIALARVEGWQVVTDEKPTGSMQRPNIPDVCGQLGMTTFNILQVIKTEK